MPGQEDPLFSQTPILADVEPVEKELTPKQLAGIRYAITLGKILQEELPEIGDEFLQGTSTGSIIRQHGLGDKFNEAAESTLEVAVMHALKGWDGSRFRDLVKQDPYPGLLPIEVYSATSRGIRSKWAHQLAENIMREKKGIHGLSPEEKSRLGSISGPKAGRIGGPRSFELHKGIHGQGPAERAEILRLATEAKGFVPWTEDEYQLLLELGERPEFQKQTRQRGIRPDYDLIAVELNRRFHAESPTRTPGGVRARLYTLLRK